MKKTVKTNLILICIVLVGIMTSSFNVTELPNNKQVDFIWFLKNPVTNEWVQHGPPSSYPPGVACFYDGGIPCAKGFLFMPLLPINDYTPADEELFKPY